MADGSFIVVDGRVRALPRRNIAASTVFAAMRDARVSCTIRNAAIGTFQCRDRTITAHVTFECCTFGQFDVSRTRFEHGITLDECSITVVNFDAAYVRGTLRIRQPLQQADLCLDRVRIDGSLVLDHVKALSLRCIGAAITGDLALRHLQLVGCCNLSDSNVSGKLDLSETRINDGCKLRLGRFAWVSFDEANIVGGIDCSRATVDDSFFARDLVLQGTLSLKAARIGGQIVLHGSLISGDLAISGLRAFGLHMKRAIVRGVFRARGIDFKESLIIKTCIIGRGVTMKGAMLAEMSFFGCSTTTIDLFNIIVSGSAVFGRRKEIENAGATEVESRYTRHREINEIERRGHFTAERLWCNGLRCRSLDLFETQIAYVRLGNVQVESVLDLAGLVSHQVTISMSKISGNLRGYGSSVQPRAAGEKLQGLNGVLKIRSSVIEARTEFIGALINCFKGDDSRFGSLIFAELSEQVATRIFDSPTKAGPSVIREILLDDLQAITVDLSSVDQLTKFVMDSSAAKRLDFSELTWLPDSLAVTKSQVDTIFLDKDAAYRSVRRRTPSDRYRGRNLDLSETTYAAIVCDVNSILALWQGVLKDRTRAPKVRPALSLLYRTLRANGYDDWADDVYVEFRKSAGLRTASWLAARNHVAGLLFGYGYSTRRIALTSFMPLVVAIALVTAFPEMTDDKTGLAGTNKPPAGLAQWTARAVNVSELIVRTFIPGGGESSSIGFHPCEVSHPACAGTMVAIAVRIAGIVCIPIFLIAFAGLIHYGERRSLEH